MSYTICRAATPPKPDSDFDTPNGSPAGVIDIAHFHARSSDHHPRTRVRVLYDDSGLYLHFHVEDRYVRAITDQYQDPVCHDSCVEAFLQPDPSLGYFNFEFSCGGVLLLYYLTGKQSEEGGHVEVSNDWLDKITIHTTLPRQVDPEITEPTTWQLTAHIPFALFQHYTGALSQPTASPWRGNFYKCADNTSHPHWGIWQPIDGPLSFHKPEFFAPLTFEK